MVASEDLSGVNFADASPCQIMGFGPTGHRLPNVHSGLLSTAELIPCEGDGLCLTHQCGLVHYLYLCSVAP
jgi:hypothetical protein